MSLCLDLDLDYPALDSIVSSPHPVSLVSDNTAASHWLLASLPYFGIGPLPSDHLPLFFIESSA